MVVEEETEIYLIELQQHIYQLLRFVAANRFINSLAITVLAGRGANIGKVTLETNNKLMTMTTLKKILPEG